MMKLLSLVFFLSSFLSLSTAFSLRHFHARTRTSGVLSAHDAHALDLSAYSTSHVLPKNKPLDLFKRKEPEPLKPQPVPEKDKKLKRDDKLDEKCFKYSNKDQTKYDTEINTRVKNLMKQRHPKKGKKGMFAELSSSHLDSIEQTAAVSAVDAVTADATFSSMESSGLSISDSSSQDLGTGVRAAGAATALRAGGESLTLPLVSTANNAHVATDNVRIYHGRLTVPTTIEYTIESGRAWTGDVVDVGRGAGLHRVRIVYGAIDQVLVFAPMTDTATHQLPAGVNRFRLIHEPKPTQQVPVPVPIATYHVTLFLGRQITYGAEIEDLATAIKLCHTNVDDGNCIDLEYSWVLGQSANTVDNIPYLSAVIEGKTAKTMIIEMVTGPVSIGTTANEYPRDAQDMSRALSHWYAQLRLDLDGMAPNDQPNLAGSYCEQNGGRGDNFWMPLDQLVTRYNARINADVNIANGDKNKWLLSLPSASHTAVTANIGRALLPQYTFRIRCQYEGDIPEWAMDHLDTQLNIAMPLAAIGARKGAAPDWTQGVAGATHFIDIFPPVAADETFGYVWEYVTRAQLVAEQLMTTQANVIGRPVNPIEAATLRGLNLPTWQITQFKGFLTAILSTALHFTNYLCAEQLAPDEHPLDPGAAKNHNVALIKTCLNDLSRLFPVALTDAFSAWWTGAHLAAPSNNAALLAHILGLFDAGAGVGGVGVDGSLPVGKCLADATRGQTARQHFQAHFTTIMNNFVTQAFQHHISWNTRYTGEDNAHHGTSIITPRVDPGADNWECMCHTPRNYDPLPNRQFSQWAILVESRHQNNPINAAFQPSKDPAAPKDLRPVLNALRRITNAA